MADHSAGRHAARVLQGAWQSRPPPITVDDNTLRQILPLLISTGAAALAWHRLNTAGSEITVPEANVLGDQARMIALNTAMQERVIEFVADLFAASGMEPIIFKGWAVARHYGSPCLRPFGDIDICAGPGKYMAARSLLQQHSFSLPTTRNTFTVHSGLPRQLSRVDLHADLEKFRLPSLEAVFARSQQIAIGRAQIRIPAPEDHLRIVVIHMLNDGAWRPVWLCDVAAMLETLPKDFDWETCLGDDSHVSHWIACVLEIAYQLLGAQIDAVPAKYRAKSLPGWLVPSILKLWSKPRSEHVSRPAYFTVLRDRPHLFWHEFVARWPDPINATVKLNGSFSAAPRWPYQIARLLVTAVQFALRCLRIRPP